MEENTQNWKLFKGSGKAKEEMNKILRVGEISGSLKKEPGVEDYHQEEQNEMEKLQGDTEAEVVFKKVFPVLETKRDEKENEIKDTEKELVKRIKDFRKKMLLAEGHQEELQFLENEQLGLKKESPEYQSLEIKISAEKENFDKIIDELKNEQTEIDKLETKLMLAEKSLKEVRVKLERDNKN